MDAVTRDRAIGMPMLAVGAAGIGMAGSLTGGWVAVFNGPLLRDAETLGERLWLSSPYVGAIGGGALAGAAVGAIFPDMFGEDSSQGRSATIGGAIGAVVGGAAGIGLLEFFART